MPHYHAPESRRKLRRLNTRQRKKYRLAEFQNLIFRIEGSLLREYQTAEHFNRFCEEVIAFIDAQQICTAGGGDAAAFSYVFDHAKNPPHNITPTQRDNIIGWFSARHDIAALRSSGLTDGYYAGEQEWDDCPYSHK